ncbi:MAG TPA: ABC transporter permease [Methylomirabilota bacterium]|nr:ABC transporter permease [Methylomirabilota bacterium]
MAGPADPVQLTAAGTAGETAPRAAALSWRRVRRSSNLLVGALIIAAVVGSAALAPLLAPYDPVDQEFTAQLRPPAPAHWFGTDEFGRDIFSRVLFGARIALRVGVVADLIATALGVLLGVVAGYVGGRLDALLTRVLDITLAFPYLLLAMVVVAILGPGLTNAMIAIAVVYTPQFARVVRGVVLSVKEQEFVEAARALGAGAGRILARGILPNIVSPIIVMSTLTVGFMIVETAGLSFLGLGASPPTPEWGSMLATGRSFMLTAPWIATFPGLAILVTVVAFNLVGDGLRDLLDPRLRGRI